MATRLFSALLLALAATFPMPVVAGGMTSAAEGQALVEMYCTDCHATGTTGESREPAAPPFRELHSRYDVEFLNEALVEGLVTGHEMMPEFEFDPGQAEAIIDYLKSLEPNGDRQTSP